jgi:hypothetical protein
MSEREAIRQVRIALAIPRDAGFTRCYRMGRMYFAFGWFAPTSANVGDEWHCCAFYRPIKGANGGWLQDRQIVLSPHPVALRKHRGINGIYIRNVKFPVKKEKAA